MSNPSLNNFNLFENLQSTSTILDLPERKTVLFEGDVSNKIYFIKKGCLRLCFNKDGKDITLQFFFENQLVCSFESFYLDEPSLFSIETVEASTLMLVDKKDFLNLIDQDLSLNNYFTELLAKRFINYNKLFLSRIKDTPEERYSILLEENPEIIKRVPQHYIASYLGITSVSLSRIKKRLSNSENN